VLEIQYLQKIFKAIPLPTLLLLPDVPHFTIVNVNTAWLTATGTCEADLVGRGIFEAFPCNREDLFSDPVSHLRRSLLTVLNTRKPHKIAARHYKVANPDIDKAGTRYEEQENIPVLDDEGNVAILIHTVADVTEKSKTDEKDRFKAELLKTIGQAVMATDMNGTINFWNKAAEEIYGWTAEEAIGKNVEDLIPAQQTKEQAIEIMSELSKGRSWSGEFMVQRKGGEVFPVYATDAPTYNQQQELSGIIGVSSDITNRKQIEHRLEMNQWEMEEINQRYDYVTKATFDAIWDWDLANETIFWGEGFQTLFGYKRDNVQQRIQSWTDHIHPDDISRVLKGIREFVAGTQTNWVDEYRFHKTDGTYAYVTDKGIVIRDEHGKAIRIVGAMQDITEKKELENLLAKVNKLARIGSWEVNVIKGTVYWSDIKKEIHEVEPDYIPDLQTGVNFYKEGATRDLVIQKMQDAIERGIPYDVELQIVTPGGKEKWIRSIGESELANGKCVRVYGSFQDIDIRKRAELAITEVLEEKNTILESIGDAFFAVDKNWMVTYWNNQAEKLLGKSKNEMLGRHLWKVFSDNIDSKSYQKYFEACETNQVVHFEDYYPALARWYEISAYPSHNGLAVYVRDITERKLSEIRLTELNEDMQKQARELAISNADLEQFAYVASHDLQEPLRMVTSFLTQLEKKYGNVLDDTGKKYIDFAVDGAKRMRQIILDLLEFSRVGQTEDAQVDLNLNELVSEIQILFRKQIGEKSAVIQVGELPVIHAYKVPLRQVFQNLIGNALKYSQKGVPAQIQITAHELKDDWQLTVTDNGIGIDPAQFDRIFIIFQRLHTKDAFPGTGMGLAVTKKIIDNLGGQIWVESTEGKGSSFYFTIPKVISK
jgi:PAS domain S-box-containing protein